MKKLKIKQPRLFFPILLLSSMAVFSADTDDRTSRIQRSLRCVCGCPHVLDQCGGGENCGLAPQLNSEIAQLLKSGKSEQEIYDIFEERYGAKIHAAPKAEGFSLLAWVLPFAGLALGAVVVVLVVKNLKPDPAAERKTRASPEIEEKYRELIEKELRK